MRRFAAVFLIAGVVFALAGISVAGAAGRPLTTTLTGAEEVPPADPDGSGFASISVNPGTGTVCYDVTTDDIDTVVAAHIHEEAFGVNGPIVVDLMPTGQSWSGCNEDVSRELALDLIREPADYYVNVHTVLFPGGAIRGQLG